MSIKIANTETEKLVDNDTLKHSEPPLFMTINHEEVARVKVKLDQIFKKQSTYLGTDVSNQNYGKMIRSTLIILCAKLIHGESEERPIDDQVISIAASIEMLHTASLVHDDIIDNATERRGEKTVNHSKGSNFAILLGDLHFTEAMNLFVESIEFQKDFGLLKNFVKMGYDLCKGELVEYISESSSNYQDLRDRYYQNIRNKTARLLEFACESGASLAGGSSEQIESLQLFGVNLGMTFQIIDDILDFIGDQESTGKTLFRDLSEGTMTLPIIYALESLNDENILVDVLNRKINSHSEIRNAAQLVVDSGGVHKAYEDALYYSDKASKELDKYQDSPVRNAMEELLSFQLERKI